MSAGRDAGADPFSPTLFESVCDRFEDACRDGDRPRVEDFWSGGEESEGLLRELLVLELVYRSHSGDGPVLDEYVARFPGHEATVRDAFAAAQDGGTMVRRSAGPADAVAPAGPPTARVADHSGEPTWISPALGPIQDEPDEDHVVDALAGAGYEVTGMLGRGGMGLVYEARQSALDRLVAVKVLRSGLFATEEECRRFLNEAEAVGRLDHSGIVPIYEIRRSRGLYFFSMRRVGGASLDRRLLQGPLAPRDAARLVSLAARAVDHAHRRGILHRDLKPANILVDEAGEPFLTDFGLARRLDPEGGGATRTGLLLGTPGYMAPEQAAGKPDDLTTATDVYGLGSVLYACLTGRPPHAGSSLVETLDRIRTSPPEPPSRINPRVPRDLEVICLKCLEMDPRRRYGTARELGDDLDRWLRGEPILARPVSTLTRARLWARRRPLPAALLAALAAAIVVGLAGIGWQWRETNRRRHQAERLLDYLANRLIGQASTEANPQGAKLTVRELLDRQASRLGGEFQGEPELEASLRETVGNAYHSLGLFEPAESHLRRALKLSDELLGPADPASIRIATRLGRVIAEAGRPGEAESLLSTTRAGAIRALGPDDATTVEATARLGAVWLALQRPADAEPLLREALAVRRRTLPVDHPDTLRSVHDLCRLAMETGRLDEAEPLSNEYEHGIRCACGPNHPDNVTALANRGLIRRLRGQLTEAEPFYRKAVDEARRILGPDHPATRSAEQEYAALLKKRDKPGRNAPVSP
jgi:tetratricopeptide (TPR) repeat protein